MVITQILGGLGNQMFQYAVGYRLSKELNTDHVLDISGFAAFPDRRYALDNLSVSARIATSKEIAPFQQKRTMSTVLRRRLKLAEPLVSGHIKEPSLGFNPEILGLTGDLLYLEGYWQSEKYFSDVADDIRREFQVSVKPKGKNLATLSHIQGCLAVSVHIRRGDYVSSKQANSMHGTTPLDYYRTAVEFVQKKHPNLELFVFSDDHAWVRENLQFDIPTTYVDHNGPNQDYEDLRLMCACQHHIIANSTFSWWGAWLAEHPDQIVIAPKKWFNAAVSAEDLVPTRWLRM